MTFRPLAEADDLDLEMAKLLREMELLSEVGGGSIVLMHSAKPEDKPPPGFSERNLSREGPPPQAFSLAEHFRYRYAHAASQLQRRVIVCQARAALRERQKGPEPWRLEKAERTEEEEVRILVTDGEGVHVAELAAMTGWPASWIRTQRERNGKDPDYGRERPNWRSLSSDDRRALVRRFREVEGWGVRKSATFLGISVTSLAYWWDKSEKAA